MHVTTPLSGVTQYRAVFPLPPLSHLSSVFRDPQNDVRPTSTFIPRVLLSERGAWPDRTVSPDRKESWPRLGGQAGTGGRSCSSPFSSSSPASPFFPPLPAPLILQVFQMIRVMLMGWAAWHI
ncbi:hypothetical protein QTO34_018210 [Cnephaeus nilssonii]|uniref:Uncharacterized protein n=1 Tax=Cnephaeus nilssonii TaxID=3371016 RepID=A0AA40HYE1_CNENI|nr:hypothetical protein QTO34_018210 [Eptesicus nilssonii]